MKSAELYRRLLNDGWKKVSQVGSHIKMEHATKNGRLIFPYHKGKEIPTGTANAILKKAALK